MAFSIACFSNDEENNISPSSYTIMKNFINSHIVVGLISQDYVYNEFTYQIKLGHTAHLKFIYVSNTNEKNKLAQYSDSFLVFINLENQKNCEKIKEIKEFINNTGNCDKTAYFVGVFKEKTKNAFGKDEVNKILDDSNFPYNYIEIDENNLNKALEGLFITVYESLQAGAKGDKFDGDKSRSKCVII